MFSIDTGSAFRDVMFITRAYELGENVVQGSLDPDEFYMHKTTYSACHRAVMRRTLGNTALKMVCIEGGAGRTTGNIPTPSDREQFCLGIADVREPAGAASCIEPHCDRAMDIKWAKDGSNATLHIVQARPGTIVAQRQATTASRRWSGPRAGLQKQPH